MKIIRTYSELMKLPTFEERFEYLKLSGAVGTETFGSNRFLNQEFYHSTLWKRRRDRIILRDNACDLGCEDRPLNLKIYIHHMNPLMAEDIVGNTDYLMNPEYLICVSHATHNAIHYGSEELLIKNPVDRKPGDTCPWR